MAGNFVVELNTDATLPPLEVGDYNGRASNHYVTDSAAGPLSTNYFSSDGWKFCSGPSLRGHIVNAHLSPIPLAGLGLPLYDVEVAQVRNIGLGWVVKKAVQRLDLSDRELIEGHLEDSHAYGAMSPDSYRLALVKTIGLISQRGMAVVPWSTVNRIYRGASDVPLNITHEGDMSFLDTHQGKLALQEAEARRAALAQFGPIYRPSVLKPHLEAELARDDFRVKLG